MPTPRSIPCSSCGGLYFKSSLEIHQRTCAQKAAATNHECPFCRGFIPIHELAFHAQHCALRPLRDNSRVYLPIPPVRVHVRPLGSGGGAAPPPAPGAARAPCSVCGRLLAAERLLVHENACRNIHRPRAVFNSAAQRTAVCQLDAGGLMGSSGPGDGTFGAPPPLPPRRASRSRGRSARPPQFGKPAAAASAVPFPAAALSAVQPVLLPLPRRSASSPPGSSQHSRESLSGSSWRDEHEGFQRMLAMARRAKQQQQQQQQPLYPPQPQPTQSTASWRSSRPATAAAALPLEGGGGSSASASSMPLPPSSSSSSTARRAAYQAQLQQIVQSQEVLQQQMAARSASRHSSSSSSSGSLRALPHGSRGAGLPALPSPPSSLSARLLPPSPMFTGRAGTGRFALSAAESARH